MLGLTSLSNGQKTVVFQGMQHIGSEDSYKSVVFDLELALADGYTLFYEVVTPVASRPDLSDWLNQTLRGTKQDLSGGYKKMADQCGLSFQLNYFDPIKADMAIHPSRHITADTNYLEMKTEYDRLLRDEPGLADGMAAKAAKARQAKPDSGGPVGGMLDYLVQARPEQKKPAGIVCRGVLGMAVSCALGEEEDPANRVIVDLRDQTLARFPDLPAMREGDAAAVGRHRRSAQPQRPLGGGRRQAGAQRLAAREDERENETAHPNVHGEALPGTGTAQVEQEAAGARHQPASATRNRCRRRPRLGRAYPDTLRAEVESEHPIAHRAQPEVAVEDHRAGLDRRANRRAGVEASVDAGVGSGHGGGQAKARGQRLVDGQRAVAAGVDFQPDVRGAVTAGDECHSDRPATERSKRARTLRASRGTLSSTTKRRPGRSTVTTWPEKLEREIRPSWRGQSAGSSLSMSSTMTVCGRDTQPSMRTVAPSHRGASTRSPDMRKPASGPPRAQPAWPAISGVNTVLPPPLSTRRRRGAPAKSTVAVKSVPKASSAVTRSAPCAGAAPGVTDVQAASVKTMATSQRPLQRWSMSLRAPIRIPERGRLPPLAQARIQSGFARIL
jgi:hypothetical protein